MPHLEVTEDPPLRCDAEVVVKEDAKGHLGLVHGPGSVILFLPEEDEVVSDLSLRERSWIGIEVLPEHARMRDVSVDRARRFVAKLDKLAEGL